MVYSRYWLSKLPIFETTIYTDIDRFIRIPSRKFYKCACLQLLNQSMTLLFFFRLILEKNYLKLNKADTELVICINSVSDTKALYMTEFKYFWAVWNAHSLDKLDFRTVFFFLLYLSTFNNGHDKLSTLKYLNTFLQLRPRSDAEVFVSRT